MDPNPEAMGPAAVEELLERVKEKLKKQLDLELDVDSHALELDSSTASKFSRHLIVALPDAAFASNAHVGALVREICDEIWEDHRHGRPTACVVRDAQASSPGRAVHTIFCCLCTQPTK